MVDHELVVTRPFTFLFKGREIRWDLPLDVYRLLRRTAEDRHELPQNIVVPAVLKYGERHNSIVKYIKRDLARRK